MHADSSTHPTPAPSRPTARRVVAFAIPLVAFVLLVALGRYATTSAAPSPAPAMSSRLPAGPDSVSAPDPTDAAPGAADIVAPDAAEAAMLEPSPRSALELLPDGAVIVDLNLATEDDLRHLPGIGAKRARAIVELRTRLGRLRGVDDLARIKGLGRNAIRKLRPWTRASQDRDTRPAARGG